MLLIIYYNYNYNILLLLIITNTNTNLTINNNNNYNNYYINIFYLWGKYLLTDGICFTSTVTMSSNFKWDAPTTDQWCHLDPLKLSNRLWFIVIIIQSLTQLIWRSTNQTSALRGPIGFKRAYNLHVWHTLAHGASPIKAKIPGREKLKWRFFISSSSEK